LVAEKPGRYCGFCGAPEDAVESLVEGPVSTICNNCVVTIAENLGLGLEPAGEYGEIPDHAPDDSKAPSSSSNHMQIPSPREIYQLLGEYVIGQEKAREILSIAAYQHLKRINYGLNYPDVEIDKSNILLIGQTGTGKTLLARSLAKIMNVPFVIEDANSFTQAGYIGRDVEDMLIRLLEEADNDVARAERGIIYIDEIDKIGSSRSSSSAVVDVSHGGVQHSLLKLIEGNEVEISLGDKRFGAKKKIINTKNILFICGGAFSGLEEILRKKNDKSSIGFSAVVEKADKETENWHAKATHEDVVKYGMTPEFIGRLPVLCSLNPLTKSDLVSILSEPKNSLVKQFKALFDMDSIEVSFGQDGLEAIAERAIENKTGARGLRSIMESVLHNSIFNDDAHEEGVLVVDRDLVAKGAA